MSFSRGRSDGRRLQRFLKASAGKCLTVLLLATCLAGSGVSCAFAADKPPEVLAAVQKAMGYFQKSAQIAAPNETGLVAYTCLAAGETPDSPVVKEMLGKVLAKITADGYNQTHHHIYEAGVDAMALAAADKVKYRDKLQLIANYLLKSQKSNGSWDYPSVDHGGDTSITQYAMLGLWAAARAGIEIPQPVIDNAASWHMRTQMRNGGFSYQPLGGDTDVRHSMTMAGVGSMGIVRVLMTLNPQDLESLSDEPEQKPKKAEKAFGVLERVTAKDTPDQSAAAVDKNLKPQVSRADVEKSIKGGMGWLASNYTVEKNNIGQSWHLYYLYGLERAASLGNYEKVGGHDWYTEGYRVILKSQNADGSWTDIGGATASTCFATLFLMRATEKLVPKAAPPKPTPKAPTVGGGLQVGGRGLPTDLGNVETTGGNITAKKTDTPLDKLLAELENPKSQKVESAQAALVEAVQVGQRDQLIGQKDLLLKLAKDSRVDVRRTAFWALGRCNDLRVAPVLIQGLMDADYDAAVEARNALCVLSRRPRGFGLPDDLIAKLPANASQAEKESAFERWRDDDLRRWRDWYQSVRPYSERDKLPD